MISLRIMAFILDLGRSNQTQREKLYLSQKCCYIMLSLLGGYHNFAKLLTKDK